MRGLLPGLAGVALGALLVEGAARALGHAPLRSERFPLTVEPAGWLVEDPAAGWTTAPGDFVATLPDGSTWRVHHPERGRRAVPGAGDGRVLLVLGDSVPYGWGVDDDETVAARLAGALAGWTVELRAVPGHSLAQTWAVLRARLAVAPPAAVVVGYASWLDERTVWARHWRRSLAAFTAEGPLGPVEVPVVRDARAPSLRQRGVLRYRPWPGQRWSAAVDAAEGAWTAHEDRSLEPDRVARAVLAALQAEARAADVPLVLLGLASDEGTRRTLDASAAQGVLVARPAVDLGRPPWSLAPVDPHPSAAGHQALAEAVLEAGRHLFGTPVVPPAAGWPSAPVEAGR